MLFHICQATEMQAACRVLLIGTGLNFRLVLQIDKSKWIYMCPLKNVKAESGEFFFDGVLNFKL